MEHGCMVYTGLELCFGIGHNLSLICQMTSEDIKHQLIIIILPSSNTCKRQGKKWASLTSMPFCPNIQRVAGAADKSGADWLSTTFFLFVYTGALSAQADQRKTKRHQFWDPSNHPRGSVPGSCLFLTFINDPPTSRARLFSDDTNWTARWYPSKTTSTWKPREVGEWVGNVLPPGQVYHTPCDHTTNYLIVPECHYPERRRMW